MKENEEQVYQIKFYFKDEKSYEVNYSYDSESKTIKCVSVKLGPEQKLKKYLCKEAVDLESALICAMQQNKAGNLTEESIKNSKEQIKNNLVKIDLGEDFLIDIIPDIFKLQNLCENNLKVEVPYMPYMGSKNKITKEKTEQIIKQIGNLCGKSGKKKITFVEKGVEKYHLDDDMNSWIQGYVCGYGGDGHGEQAEKYKTRYANWKRKEIDQQEEEVDSDQKRKESQNLYYKQLKNTYDLDSQKSKTNEKISRAGKIARIIFLIALIAFAIFLPTYLGIIGLLFSNVAIPIIVFSVEAILITLIVILILVIKNIYSQNDLLQKQSNLGGGEFSNSEPENLILMEKNKNGQKNKKDPEPNQLIKNNGQNLG